MRNKKLIIIGVILVVLVLLGICCLVGVVLVQRQAAAIEEAHKRAPAEQLVENLEKSAEEKIEKAEDLQRKVEATSLLAAIQMYTLDNQGEMVTYDGGRRLPTVTKTNVITNGANATEIEGLVPEYLASLEGMDNIKVGVTSNGRVVVGAELNDGTTYVQER